ncbi:DNA mismatch repair endonuclease MutL [Puniceicoccales bacterium CK1056]|uniref:DNA mismatch repair protein MutL n=1 Tax=Oceanipulchritudo coccoides TaxID=2706888 RepID=A0A6B2M0C8_9BACT|nr:DNA mismatch repair endonuclease MutL [Oceanipulchritudo coccoides]NDV62368.1 DNA mismatch repair endonuclease MutL [Oceanipulchritudo coccoides]
MSGRIVKLPDSVANQIAAGEVVERPVAVVKELVENALDAEAKSIEVQFEKGGKALMRVLDDGIGMTREDAILSLERHATSKIREVGDILKIGSFGFRGEALPSIASVSRFTLKTRTREAGEGTEIQINANAAPVIKDCGMSPGTEVTVANLFQTVPARRKFLKTDRTEAAHILQMCRLLAIAHPEVGFSLVEDGHEVFRSPACPDYSQRVREIFGKRRMEELLPIDCEVDGIQLKGLVGRPGSARSTRSEMITYVNDRPVDSRLLNYALIESYHRFIPRGRYPMAFLFVGVPSEEVDVNVHPTKREVRFRNEPRVRSAVMNGLIEFLGEHSHKSLRRAEPVESQQTADQVEPGKQTGTSPWEEPRPFPRIIEKPFAPVAAPEQTARKSDQSAWRFCGTFRRHVGLFESPDGLVLLHAAAARERILFERIEGSLAGENVARQPLLIPSMLELSPVDAGILSDQIQFFDKMGFEIEPFGRQLFRIRSVPAWMQSENPEQFVEEIVSRIRERGIRPEDALSARSLVARMAATREARGFQVSSQGDWESLVRSLLSCENPLLNARGKPTFVEMRHGEISRKLMLDGISPESDGLEGGS